MSVDWSRLESMFGMYGLDNLASEAKRHGQERDLSRKMDETALTMQRQQVEHMLKQAREADKAISAAKARVDADKRAAPSPPLHQPKRAADVRFSDLPVDARDFVDVLVRQAELGVLYTSQGVSARGVPYEMTASMYEERLDGVAERNVVLLLETERAAGKATVTYQQRGTSWTRVRDEGQADVG